MNNKTTCNWSEDEDGYWETECGDMHCFLDGGPTENKYQFCPYCRGEIIENKFTQTEIQ